MSQTPNPKKRKASQISKTIDAYCKLLNTTIQELTQPPQPHPFQPFSTTQIGLTTWSAEEKDLFFDALGKVERWDVEGIAARMARFGDTGKSILEVRQYIEVLERGVKEVGGRLGMEEMEAAKEVSGECCEALDEIAGILEAKERKAGERMERGFWGEKEWLFDWEKAIELKDRVESRNRFERDEGENEGGNGEKKEEVREKVFGLLDPANFLALSGHLFMNTAAPLDENWQSIVSQSMKGKNSTNGGEPAIRMTGLRDFHNLIVSVTRRTVATAYYCAESRLKATFIKGDRPKKRVVRRKDVWAALKMLGLEANSERWWENVYERCGLNAFEGNERRGSGNDSSKGRPEQVGEDEESDEEAIANSTDSSSEDESGDENLGHEGGEEQGQEVEMLPITQSRRPDQPEDSNSKYEENPNNQDAASQTSHQSHHSTTSSSSNPSSTAHIDLLDTHASHLEEQNLWTLLNRKPPPHLDLSVPDIPKKKERGKHYQSRKIGTNAVERWRERIEYWSEWEVMRGTVGEEEFRVVGGRKGGGGGKDGGDKGPLSGERVRDSDLEDEREDDDGVERRAAVDNADE